MIPLIKSMAPAFGGADKIEPLWWCLSLGACLGGNGTLIGASANLTVAGIAERNGVPFRFITYTLYAFPMMLCRSRSATSMSGGAISEASGLSPRASYGATRPATSSASDSAQVRPAIRSRRDATKPERPCSAGPSMTKSAGGSPGPVSFGRMPE